VSRWAAPWHDVDLRHGEEPALVSSVRAGRIKMYRRSDERMAAFAVPWCWRREPRFHMLVMMAPLVVVTFIVHDSGADVNHVFKESARCLFAQLSSVGG